MPAPCKRAECSYRTYVGGECFVVEVPTHYDGDVLVAWSDEPANWQLPNEWEWVAPVEGASFLCAWRLASNEPASYTFIGDDCPIEAVVHMASYCGVSPIALTEVSP